MKIDVEYLRKHNVDALIYNLKGFDGVLQNTDSIYLPDNIPSEIEPIELFVTPFISVPQETQHPININEIPYIQNYIAVAFTVPGTLYYKAGGMTCYGENLVICNTPNTLYLTFFFYLTKTLKSKIKDPWVASLYHEFYENARPVFTYGDLRSEFSKRFDLSQIYPENPFMVGTAEKKLSELLLPNPTNKDIFQQLVDKLLSLVEPYSGSRFPYGFVYRFLYSSDYISLTDLPYADIMLKLLKGMKENY